MTDLYKEELVRRIRNTDAEEQRVIAAQLPAAILCRELEARYAYMESQLATIRDIFNDSVRVEE